MACRADEWSRLGGPAAVIARGAVAGFIGLTILFAADRGGMPVAAADDDVVVDLSPPKPPVDALRPDDAGAAKPDDDGGDATRPPPPADEPGGPFIVTLGNGDRLTGSITTLGPRGLQIRPDVAAGGVVDVPLARIDGIERRVPIEPLEARGDRLLPVAGGAMSGELVGMKAQGVTIDVHLVGRVQLPLTALAAFVREGETPPERTAEPRFAEVHTKSGSLVVGHLAFESTGLGVSNAGLSAKIAFEQIRAILFPADGQAAPAADASACRIELCNGSEICCAAAELDGAALRVRIGGTEPIVVPLDHVSRLAFGAGGAAGGRRRVVIWSMFVDADEEGKNMSTALREGLPPGWAVADDADLRDADALTRGLPQAGVFVVPEMESFEQARAPDPEKFGKVLRGFLATGGTVVICSIDGETQKFWEQTGLLTLTSLDRVAEDEDEGSFAFVPGHWLGAKVGESFQGTNGTYAYQTDDEDLQPVATNHGEAAAALVKKVGRGRIVLLGMDFYHRSEAIDRVLVNAVTGGR